MKRFITQRLAVLCLLISIPGVAAGANWPQFRGPGASGVSDVSGPVQWEVKSGKGIRWNISVPGLGHSCPVIWGDRIYLTSAVPVTAGDENLRTGLYGDIEPVEENAEYRWLVLCFDKKTGAKVWEREARRGKPRVKRHPKSSHANPTPATDGTHIVVSFGSEGLYCYDLDGNVQWKKDLGVMDAGYYMVPDAQWGYASSPVIAGERTIVLADVQKNSFLAALDVDTGDEKWRTPRNDVPTWGTPGVFDQQIVVNGFREMAGYNLADGKQVWKLAGGGDIPVPTPVAFGKDDDRLIFLTSAHGPQAPIHAIVLNAAKGDISLSKGQAASNAVAWSIKRGGNYMQTPIVVGDYACFCLDNGVLTCYEARTGKQMYRTRCEGDGFTASAVAAGDRIYFTSEDGHVIVVKAGPRFGAMAEHDLGEQTLATPAVSDGVVYWRTKTRLLAIDGK
jgi:outer membrane protein assembly factor BamB